MMEMTRNNDTELLGNQQNQVPIRKMINAGFFS